MYREDVDAANGSIQTEIAFKNVRLMVFVFDATSSLLHLDDKQFRQCVSALADYSPHAEIIVLFNKCDVVKEQLDKVRTPVRPPKTVVAMDKSTIA